MFKSNAYKISALIGFHVLVLLYFTTELSISYYEANTYFNKTNLLHYIIKFSTYLLGQNDFALRLPMILMHAIGAFLYYDISKDMFKKQADKIWNLVLYLLLPGVNSAALMVDGAGLVLFLLLVFLFMYKHKPLYGYILLTIYVFIEAAFGFMFLAIIFFSIEKRDTRLLVASIILFTISMYMFGIDFSGYPKNYFLNTLGIYAAIFSPIVFIFLIYSLYKWGRTGDRNLLWYLGVTAFLFSMLLSFRQQMQLQELAPFLIVASPIMVKTFLSSYRIRLRMFRKQYRFLLVVGSTFLILSTVSIFMNKYLYLFISQPSKHFVYQNHIVKELSAKLKEMGINEVVTKSKRYQLRLKFYGIKKGYDMQLTHKESTYNSRIVTISYMGKEIDKFYVTKLYK